MGIMEESFSSIELSPGALLRRRICEHWQISPPVSLKGEHGGSCLNLVGWGQVHSSNHPHWLHRIVLIHTRQNFQLVPSEDVSQVQRPGYTASGVSYTLMFATGFFLFVKVRYYIAV